VDRLGSQGTVSRMRFGGDGGLLTEVQAECNGGCIEDKYVVMPSEIYEISLPM
jgi:hypothetical protein